MWSLVDPVSPVIVRSVGEATPQTSYGAMLASAALLAIVVLALAGLVGVVVGFGLIGFRKIRARLSDDRAVELRLNSLG